MIERRSGGGSKYSDDFKRRLVLESYTDGANVEIVSRRHGVSKSALHAWRREKRFQVDVREGG